MEKNRRTLSDSYNEANLTIYTAMSQNNLEECMCVNVSTLTRGEKSLKVKRIRVYKKTKNRPLRENS